MKSRSHSTATAGKKTVSPPLPPAAGLAESEPVVIAPEALAKLACYAKLVDEIAGSCEFAVLLLGQPSSDLVEDIYLLHAQEVSSGSFFCPPEAFNESLAAAQRSNAGLIVRGIAHRHPGSGPSSVYHSSIDKEYIEGEILPAIGLHSLKASEWVRDLTVRHDQGDLTLDLDKGGRQKVRIRMGRSGAATACVAPPLPAAEISATLAVLERASEVLSIVFSADVQHFYCCALGFRFVPTATRSGEVEVRRIVDRREPKVRPPEDPPCAFQVDTPTLEREVRERVKTWSGPYRSKSRPSSSGVYDFWPSTVGSTWYGVDTGPSTIGKPAGATTSFSVAGAPLTTTDLVTSAIVQIEEAAHRCVRDGSPLGPRLWALAGRVNDVLSNLLDESWSELP